MAKRLAVAMLVGGLLLMLPIAASGAYPDYGFVDIWGGPGTGPGQFAWACVPVEGPYGEIFVSDMWNDRIEVFDQDGTYLRQIGTSGSGPGQMNGPVGMTITDEDVLFVAEHDGNRISAWGTNGDWYGVIASVGTGDGQVTQPADVEIGPDGLLYVADWSNHRVQVLEQDGTFVRAWGTSGTGDGQFSTPISIEFDRDGQVWVADNNLHRIQYFEPDGTFLGKMGALGTAEGEFNNPYDIEFDPHGYLYVADWANSRMQKFTPDLTFVTKLGTPGTDDGEFANLWGVLPTSERYLLATDQGNARVQRFFTAVPTEYEPVAGSTRFTTAVEASKKTYPHGLMEDVQGYKTVIVATGRNWPDALGGSALAGVLDAPILLVDTDALPAAVGAEIVRLKATRVIVLGGATAVSASVATAIDALSGVTKVERLGGANRYLTAEIIAKRAVDLQGSDYDYHAFVATGDNFPDALACSPVAAANGWPLYLVPSAGLRDSTKTAMQNDGVADVHVLGGTAAVSAATESQLNTLLGDANVDRIAGDTRYETAVEIGWWAQSYANMNWTYTALATGLDFPDALTGGPMQGRDRSIMLLTKGTAAIESVVGSSIEDHKNAVWTVRYLGGTAAVSQATRDSVENLLY